MFNALILFFILEEKNKFVKYIICIPFHLFLKTKNLLIISQIWLESGNFSTASLHIHNSSERKLRHSSLYVYHGHKL